MYYYTNINRRIYFGIGFSRFSRQQELYQPKDLFERSNEDLHRDGHIPPVCSDVLDIWHDGVVSRITRPSRL